MALLDPTAVGQKGSSPPYHPWYEVQETGKIWYGLSSICSDSQKFWAQPKRPRTAHRWISKHQGCPLAHTIMGSHCCHFRWWARDTHIYSSATTTSSNFCSVHYSNTTALAPHLGFQCRTQWVLLTGKSSGEETGGRPPLKIHLPTASEINSQ